MINIIKYCINKIKLLMKKNNFIFKDNKKKVLQNKTKKLKGSTRGNIYKSNIKMLKLKNNISFLLFLNLIFIFIINTILCQSPKNNKRNLNTQSIIYLNVTGTKSIKILGSKSSLFPDKIYLNDIEVDIDNSGNINIEKSGKNNVTMIWNKPLQTCEKLFQSASTVTEIDLSHFDTSKVKTMKGMFVDCTYLKYINFTNVITSTVTDMTNMFSGCNSLTSLDLSGFDTSKVSIMESMFSDCISLTFLNLSNFKTPSLTKMKSMFFNCKLLRSLDISNFDTSKISNMETIFFQCSSLISLNISSFNTLKVKSMESMLDGCKSLKSLDLSKIQTPVLTNMMSMFSECTSLTSLNISNLSTSKVENMEQLFYGCSSLISLDLSNLQTSKVNYMDYMFYGCTSLKSLDLSSFSFEKVTMTSCFANCYSLKSIKFPTKKYLVADIETMFYECWSLKSLDLSCFDFYNIKDMGYLFYGCSSLTSLDTSNLNIYSATNMEYMFYGCNELESLDLSTWKTLYVENIRSMFYDCNSLTYIDLSKFNSSSVTDMKDLFFNCIKLTSINLKHFDTSKVTDMSSMFYGCSFLQSLDLSSFNTSLVTNMKSMFYSCIKLVSLDLSNFNIQNVRKMGSMFSTCKNLSFINFYNYNNTIASMKDMFYQTSSDLIICINNLTKTIRITTKLSESQCIVYDCNIDLKQKQRIIFDKRICLNDCLNDKEYKYEYNNFCYSKCPTGTHLKDGNYSCEKNINDCIAKYPFLNIETNKCIEDCGAQYFFNNKCRLNNYNIESQRILIKNIINGLEDGSLDDLINQVLSGEREDIIKEYNGIIYQIESSFNRKDENISKVILGECENVLKGKYNISKNETLIIFKTEYKIEGLSIPFIEYDIFNPITKKKLDINVCKNSNINISIETPIFINETNLFIYEPNNSFYNDICHTYTTENGIDISLYDRKNNYNNNINISLCAINCVYTGYDLINKKVICQCEPQERISLYKEVNKDLLANNLINIKSIHNLNVLKCHNIIFSKKGLITNIGSYIIISIIFLHMILAILFYLKGYNLLCQQINQILKIKILENEIEISSKKDLKEEKENNITDLSASIKKDSNFNKSKKKSDFKLVPDLNLSKEILNNKSKKNNEKLETEKSVVYFDYEMQAFSYEDALEYDKRTYLQFYISLIKIKQILIFTFFTNNDYNSFIIKLCIFSFSFSLHVVINTMFFNDSTMHKIYEDKGEFNLNYLLPQIIYSSLISSFITNIIKILSLSNQDILEIKYENNKFNLNAKVLIVIKCLIIKYICFFIISFIALICFWYYLSCFCAVYKNTQIYLIKTVLISFSFSLIYPFIICLFPGIFRIFSLRTPGKYLYKISRYIQLA